MSNQNKMAGAIKNLAYVTELGFLLVIPLVLLLFLANFLQSRFGWGQWTTMVGLLLGILCGVANFWSFAKYWTREAKKNEDENLWK